MNKKVPFLDLRIVSENERASYLKAIENVFLHGVIINGPEVADFEKCVADYTGRQYAVGVNSGTDALLLSLLSLGIGAGDEVITTSLSWVATANAIALTGAAPVFVDIQNDLNIDPGCVEDQITKRTKAILPVHYTGRVCEMESLKKIAQKHNLYIIEDAAQSFGAEKYGRKAGTFGDIACFSMNSMKVFASCGEAGMVITDDKKNYELLLALRYNGTINKEVCIQPSLNGRMDTIQAAFLLERFKLLPGVIQKRKENASLYNKLFYGIVETPDEKEDESNVYYTYTIQVDRRDDLKEYLESQGIETKIQHPILMPDQPAYKKNSDNSFPNARRLVDRILCVPANEKITREQIECVVDRIKFFYNQ